MGGNAPDWLRVQTMESDWLGLNSGFDAGQILEQVT